MSDPQQLSIRIVAVRHPFTVFDPHPWQPPLNVYEAEQGFLIIAELAGVDAAGLDVDVQQRRATIRGTRNISVPEGLRRLHRMEIVSGPFQIDVQVGAPIDPEHSEARYNNGLLEVWLPFAPEDVQRVVVVRADAGGAQ